MSETGSFDYQGIFDALADHGVRYVVIGGLAAVVQGSPIITLDVDICHDRSPDNLVKLAAALVALNARLRGVEDEVPFILDAETLDRGDNFTFITSAGALDCLGHPAGTEGYPDLIKNATPLVIDGELTIQVASLSDLIRMKEAAGRPKDRIQLENLGALQNVLDRRERETRDRE